MKEGNGVTAGTASGTRAIAKATHMPLRRRGGCVYVTCCFMTSYEVRDHPVSAVAIRALAGNSCRKARIFRPGIVCRWPTQGLRPLDIWPLGDGRTRADRAASPIARRSATVVSADGSRVRPIAQGARGARQTVYALAGIPKALGRGRVEGRRQGRPPLSWRDSLFQSRY